MKCIILDICQIFLGGGDSGDEEDEDDEMAVMDEEEEEDSEGESEMVVLDPDHVSLFIMDISAISLHITDLQL